MSRRPWSAVVGAPASTRRSSLVFGAAMVASTVGQAAWLVAGARVFTGSGFGTALTALAIYGVLQIVVDNGASFHGARLAARSDLGARDREELAHARVQLALAGAVAGLLVAAVGGAALLVAFAPFALALALFAVLNVWESYGEGRVVPYATYLVLRSAVPALVIGGVAIAGAGLPVAAVGLCEIAAVALAGAGAGRWLLPRGRPRIRSRTWRSVFDIGAPSLVWQYDFAVATILLGVSGRTSAAAVCGVTLRLLSGVQGVSGAVLAALFPRLARSVAPAGGDLRASRLTAWGIVWFSHATVLATAIAAPLLVRAFLDTSGSREQTTLVLGVGGAAAAGLVLQQSFIMVAGGRERRLLRAFASGAGVITLVGVLAAAAGGRDAATIAVAGFVAGQVLTLWLLLRGDRGQARDAGGALLAAGGAAIPGLALGLALAGDRRAELAAWIAAASVAFAAAGAVRLRRRARDEQARQDDQRGDVDDRIGEVQEDVEVERERDRGREVGVDPDDGH